MASVGLRAPAAEQRRLAALHEYQLLDAPAGDELEAVVRVAATVAGVPTATLNLIDEHRQCQLTTVGFDGGDSAREDSMCASHFQAGRFVHIPDASGHPAYARNPWVTGKLANVRFYASAPLITPAGHALGSLCVFDDRPHVLLPEQIARLEDLAQIVLALFERRRQSRRNAELAAEAAQRRQFTDTVLDTVDVAIAAVDPTGHLTLFNRAAREWHGGLDADPGIDPGDFSGRYALFRTDGVSFLPAEEVPLLVALRDGEVRNAEMIIKRRAGEPVHVSVNGRRLTDADGVPWGAVVAMNDVTTDRAQRRALQHAHRQLTEASGRLTATIAELRRSNAELSDFTAAVSHDLVSPLAVVHGYLDLVVECSGSDLDDQAQTWIGAAGRAVQRMQQLIDALLTYASAGNTRYQRRPADLAALLEQTLTDLRGQLDDGGAEVSVPRPLPTVHADPTMLRQLLQNLISNAVKYRDAARPCRIVVTADENADVWTIAVADNGIGIPAAERRRIFDMFAQVEPGARPGHGIGLSTCQRIVSRHGGRILADETPGGGTTIRFTLPKPA